MAHERVIDFGPQPSATCLLNGKPTSLAHRATGFVGSYLVAGLCLCGGSMLLAVLNNDIGPVIVAGLLLAVGVTAHLLPMLMNRYSIRAFVLTFSVCVCVAGLAQAYSLAAFGTAQSTIDAERFYGLAMGGLGTNALDGLWIRTGAPLALVAWQFMYSVCDTAGFSNGPWIAVLLNGMLVGLASSVVVSAGRSLWGDDDRRLRRLGTLFSVCGICWLFGAILLRDCFALLVNAVFLRSCVVWLKAPNVKTTVAWAVTLVLALVCMHCIRRGLEPLFLLFVFLAIITATRGLRSSAMRMLVPVVLASAVLALLPALFRFSAGVSSRVAEEAASYEYHGEITAGAKGLGYRLVVSQPMPIRLVVGSVHLLINPIPLWHSFRWGVSEYNWLKGWQGLFLVWVTPAAIVGVWVAGTRTFRERGELPALRFLTFYAAVTLLAVAATSLETRHHGQFLPAILMLACVPDATDPRMRSQVRLTRGVWLLTVVVGHGVWAVAKMV